MPRLTNFALLLCVLSFTGCGGGGDASADQKQVSYSDRTLLVNGVPFTSDPVDFIPEKGRVYVLTTTNAEAQADLSKFVQSFGLKTGQFQVIGRQPPFSAWAPVDVREGFESQWAQALRNTPPGAPALTRVPCC
jgi:hypothetical protein